MPKNYNRIYLQRITVLETKYAPKIFRKIKDFRLHFIAVYKEHGKDYAMQRLQLTHLHAGLADTLQGIYKEAGVMGASMTSQELKEQAGNKAGGFGRNQGWINAVTSYLKLHLLKLVQNISDTMRDDIVRVLQRAVDKGISINETVELLKDEGLMQARARVIARTEVVRAANVGHAAGAAESPYEVLKVWSAAKDHRTRHSHRSINEHTVDELGKFNVAIYKGETLIGHEEMDGPGDPNASAANTVNCRCRKYYRPKTDAVGNLIPRRNPNGATIVPMRSNPRYTPAQLAAILKSRVVMKVD